MSAPTPPQVVRLRFVALPQRVVRARSGGRFSVRVDSDAPTVAWRLGKRRGIGGAHPLVLRAPARPGRYALAVRVGAHTAHATVVAAARR
jgi:hypothetical protein